MKNIKLIKRGKWYFVMNDDDMALCRKNSKFRGTWIHNIDFQNKYANFLTKRGAKRRWKHYYRHITGRIDTSTVVCQLYYGTLHKNKR